MARFICTLAGVFYVVAVVLVAPAAAQPRAEMVMDARTGQIFHSENADARLHPASLTKMMTLYIAFEAVRLGEISMDTPVTISRNAASTPYAIGFRAGDTVELRYLVRAAAVRSSNDAATAIAEAISGSEAAFARRMTRTAEALGMTRTTFRNAHGLTADGHLSTARDMTLLGRRLITDYPEYFNLFGRTSTFAGPIGTVRNTNRHVLTEYTGADGIKTGYTRPAGYNLVGSARRGDVRILATVFGGTSRWSRDERIMELLSYGFARAPARAEMRRPPLPQYGPGRVTPPAVTSSPRPIPRPGRDLPDDLIAAITTSVGRSLAEVQEPALAPPAAAPTGPPDPMPQSAGAAARPPSETLPSQTLPAETPPGVIRLTAETVPDTRPQPRPVEIDDLLARAAPAEPEVVVRSSSTGSRLFGVSLGYYTTENAATRALLTTALAELGTFDTALRSVARRPDGFEARFAGMTEDEALAACVRLTVRDIGCTPFGPS